VRLVAELVADANRIGARVVLLTIPSPLYLAGGDASYDRVVAGFRILVGDGPNRLIVTDAMFADSQRRGEAVFLANDGHLNDTGHRLVARALADAILANGD